MNELVRHNGESMLTLCRRYSCGDKSNLSNCCIYLTIIARDAVAKKSRSRSTSVLNYAPNPPRRLLTFAIFNGRRPSRTSELLANRLMLRPRPSTCSPGLEVNHLRGANHGGRWPLGQSHATESVFLFCRCLGC